MLVALILCASCQKEMGTPSAAANVSDASTGAGTISFQNQEPLGFPQPQFSDDGLQNVFWAKFNAPVDGVYIKQLTFQIRHNVPSSLVFTDAELAITDDRNYKPGVIAGDTMTFTFVKPKLIHAIFETDGTFEYFMEVYTAITGAATDRYMLELRHAVILNAAGQRYTITNLPEKGWIIDVRNHR